MTFIGLNVNAVENVFRPTTDVQVLLLVFAVYGVYTLMVLAC